ncbi:MAG: IS110 family transposase [Saprospiraceae bacterium]|nr:IS110 family transposase [Saprospiraceae bacterium]
MKRIFVAGDISKEKIDFCIYDGESFLASKVVKNSKSELSTFLKQVDTIFTDGKKENVYNECVFAFEYTGVYNNIVLKLLEKYNFKVALLYPGSIKAVVNFDRAKNDTIDAQKIAEFAYRFYDKLNFYSPLSNEMQELKALITERSALVKVKSQLISKKDDQNKFLPSNISMFLKKNNEKIEKELDEAINNIEVRILKVIKSDEKLKENFEIAISVPGIGPATAAVLIACTNNFNRFKNAKQLGCYSGVVPFQRSSGAYKGKNKVSPKANKQLKTLLHLGAVSVLNSKNIFGEFYNRKTGEGKNKMSVINSVRNKILKTVFACVTNKQKFKPDYKFQFAA